MLIWNLERKEYLQERTQVSDLTGDHAQAVQRSIESALSANNALGALVRQGNGTVYEFESIGSQMLPFYPGIAALGLAPNGVIGSVVPLLGNEVLLGFDQLRDPVQGAESIRARDSGKLTLVGPIKLIQGGLGVVGRQPVYIDAGEGTRRFWGFTFVTLRISEVLKAAHLQRLTERGYRYRLWRMVPNTGVAQDIHVSEPPPGDDPVVRSILLPNGEWFLSATPAQGWGATSLLALRCALGLLFSLLMAYLTRLLLQLKTHEQGLEALVNERTSEIQAAEQQLKATIDAIPDLLLEIDSGGRILHMHHQRPEMLLGPVDVVVGSKVADVVSAVAEQTIMQALAESQAHGWSTGHQLQFNLPALGMTWFELSVARKAVAVGTVSTYIVLARDITLQHQAQDQIRHLAHFDHLTGLPNRALLTEHAARDIAQQQNGGSLAVLFLDLDHFKNVNDSLGHRIGDTLLVAVSQRLQALVREQDTVARLGGDEFLLLLPGACTEQAESMAVAILAALASSFQIEQYELITTLSVGIAMFPDDGDNFETLYQRADAAMYRAKRSGRNRLSFFTPELESRSARTLLLENALHRALERRQFEVYYQPQVSLQSRQIIGAEALLRWHHPQLGMVSPAEFIPIAENSGMIVSIGEWVLQTALHDAKGWLDQQLSLRTVSVNLSAVQFRHPQLPEMVSRCLEEAQLPAHRLELELTEGAAIDDPEAALTVMRQLHACGARLSMDDFGTGYSSLSQLKRFPIFKLKIDQSFVRDLAQNASDRAIVTATVHMAQALGMQTTAEGVETEEQLALLLERGCTEGQGYLFSRPVPASAFEALLHAQQL
ncbi:MAG: EAL domain-containing protein [Burkholderiaceae bacterium]|nr:EAL domain-containing protein [Burkholderiaceae bacterium]